MQAIFDVIHRAAYPVTVRISFTEMYSKCYLCEFGTHTKKSRAPHPEYRTGTTNGNCTCYTCNIAGSYRSRKGGTDRLKWCHGAVTGFIPPEKPAQNCFYRKRKSADLDKPGSDTQV